MVKSVLIDLIRKFRDTLSTVKTTIFFPPEISEVLSVASVLEYRADRAKQWKERGVVLLEEEQSSHPVAMVLVTKDVDETLAAVGELAHRGAHEIFLIGANDRGIGRYQKIFSQNLIGEVVSKFHHKILHIRVTTDIVALRTKGAPHRTPENLWGVAGTFSSAGADVGSKLLADTLPLLAGEGADLCAGNGYLTCKALKQGAQKVTLIEVDRRALDLARKQLVELNKESCAELVWTDLLSYETTKRFSWVVMNPPFHNDFGMLDVPYGSRCIRKARELLNPHGKLFMVSLATNKYEMVLKELFREVSVLITKEGFSVFRAAV